MVGNKLAGKFQLLSRQPDCIYVGLLGNVEATELYEDEIRHIAHFYNVDPNGVTEWHVLKEEDAVPDCRYPRNNYNGGIVKINH